MNTFSCSETTCCALRRWRWQCMSSRPRFPQVANLPFCWIWHSLLKNIHRRPHTIPKNTKHISSTSQHPRQHLSEVQSYYSCPFTLNPSNLLRWPRTWPSIVVVWDFNPDTLLHASLIPDTIWVLMLVKQCLRLACITLQIDDALWLFFASILLFLFFFSNTHIPYTAVLGHTNSHPYYEALKTWLS